jgi:hypothetical protein
MKLPEITPLNTIRTFALVIVAITSGFVMGMVIWLTRLLSDPSWCDRAIGAAKGADRPETAFGGCFQLLTQQMSALAINSYIFGGVIALCLAALMIIVVAGGKLSFTGNKDGVSANISGAGDTPAPTMTTTTKTEVKAADAAIEDTP